MDVLCERGSRWNGHSSEARKYFLFEKRNKKLLLCWLTRLTRMARVEESKSFLVLFFKKETASLGLGSTAATQVRNESFVICQADGGLNRCLRS